MRKIACLIALLVGAEAVLGSELFMLTAYREEQATKFFMSGRQVTKQEALATWTNIVAQLGTNHFPVVRVMHGVSAEDLFNLLSDFRQTGATGVHLLIEGNQGGKNGFHTLLVSTQPDSRYLDDNEAVSEFVPYPQVPRFLEEIYRTRKPN